MLTLEGFDDCIIGICARYGQNEIVAYSYGKIIDKLIDDGMSADEAREYFDYNILGGYLGPNTPCFIEKVPTEYIKDYWNV